MSYKKFVILPFLFLVSIQSVFAITKEDINPVTFFNTSTKSINNPLDFITSSEEYEATPILKIKIINAKKESKQSYVYVDRNGFLSAEAKIINTIELGEKSFSIKSNYTLIDNSKPIHLSISNNGQISQSEPLSVHNAYIHLDFSRVGIKKLDINYLQSSIIGGAIQYQTEEDYKFNLQEKNDNITDIIFLCVKILGLIGLLGLSGFLIKCYKEYRQEKKLAEQDKTNENVNFIKN